MQPEHTPDEQQIRRFQNLHKVTPLSKYLAMALFVALPFLGGWIGYTYAPEKVVEVETMPENKATTKPEVEEPAVSNSQTVTTIENPQNPEANRDIQKIFQVDDWVTEIDRKSFSFHGTPGAVVHKCIASQVFSDTYGGDSDRCFGINVISLEWNNKIITIDSIETPTIESLISIRSITFNENSFKRNPDGGMTGASISTSSNKASSKLLISLDPLPCLGKLPDLCWGQNQLEYAISLPALETAKLDIEIPEDGEGSWAGGMNYIDTSKMIWNEAGTKALVFPPAPAGCPGSVYDLLDLEAETIEMYRIEPEDCFPPHAVWLDNDTFQAGSSTVSTSE